MYILLTGLFVFLGIHLVSSLVNFRSNIVSRLGEGPYKGLYSVFAWTDFNSLWEIEGRLLRNMGTAIME